MTATNHAITGALIGLLVGQPLIAIPAAFLSHFVCDALPHYGNDKNTLWSKSFKRMLLIDCSLCVVLVLILAAKHPEHWLLASLCAFLATSPDLLWLPKFIFGVRHQRDAKLRRIDRLLGSEGIQWFQRPIGAVVEVAWLGAGITILSVFLR